MTTGEHHGRLPQLPQAFFDEFGNSADDRVQDYAREAIALTRPAAPEYDRELIAEMLGDLAGRGAYTGESVAEQIRLLNAAENATAHAETVSRPAAPDAVRGLVERARQEAHHRRKGHHNGLRNKETAKLLEELAPALAAPAVDYPECSGDPASCPENEGRGCCKPNPSAPSIDAGESCTCPSGDGSLRWPCPTHPPAASAPAVDGGECQHRSTTESADGQHRYCNHCKADLNATPPADAEQRARLRCGEDLIAKLPKGWLLLSDAMGYLIARDAGDRDTIKSFRGNDEAEFLEAVADALRERPAQVEYEYRAIAHLIGSIFFAGDFKAETANERTLESLLRKVGTRYSSWEEVVAGEDALATTPPPAVDVVRGPSKETITAVLHEVLDEYSESLCADAFDELVDRLAQRPGVGS